MGWVDLTKSIRAEHRALSNVGLVSVPVTPIQFEARDARCVKIQSASMLDGTHFVFYAKNQCDSTLPSASFSYRILAQDGTVIESNVYAFDGDRRLEPKERREQIVRIEKGVARASIVCVTGID